MSGNQCISPIPAHGGRAKYNNKTYGLLESFKNLANIMVSSQRSLQVGTTILGTSLWAPWESCRAPMESLGVSYVSTVLSSCEHDGTKDATCHQ